MATDGGGNTELVCMFIFLKEKWHYIKKEWVTHCKCTPLGSYGGMLIIIITLSKRKNNGMTLVRFSVWLFILNWKKYELHEPIWKIFLHISSRFFQFSYDHGLLCKCSNVSGLSVTWWFLASHHWQGCHNSHKKWCSASHCQFLAPWWDVVSMKTLHVL